MATLSNLLLLGGAGALGTLARYATSELANRLAGGSYQLGTLTVNVLGSFLFGFIWHLAAVRLMIPDQVRLLLLVGFMGSFTTFSSFMFDSFALGQERLSLLFCNILVQVVLGMGALLLGMTMARHV